MHMIERYRRPHLSRVTATLIVRVVAFCVCVLGVSVIGDSAAYGQGATDTTGIETRPESSDSTLLRDHPEHWRLGAYLAINLNQYGATDMRGLPGVPNCCPGYEGGGGTGMTIGGLFEDPMSGRFSLGARLLFSTYNGALSERESTTGGVHGFAETVLIEHRIDADIWSIGLEPVAMFDVTPEFRIFAGLRGDAVIRKRFHQTERIISPDDIYYENDTQERLGYEGAIPNANPFYGSIVGGASYDFRFGGNGEWSITPEVTFWYGPTPVVSQESWTINGLRLGFSGQFHKLYTLEELLLDGGDRLTPEKASDEDKEGDEPEDDEGRIRTKRHGSGAGG